MLEYDEKFFKYFSPPKYNYYIGGNPLSVEEAERLNAVLEERGKTDYNYHLCHIIFQLQILTEIRVCEFKRIKINSFRETAKKGVYELIIPRKGSQGEERIIPLAPKAMELLRHAIQYTDPIRRKCGDPFIRDHLFIHPWNRGNVYKYGVFSSSTYGRLLNNVAEESQIVQLDSRRIRSAHSTFAARIVKKAKKSDCDWQCKNCNKTYKTMYLLDEINEQMPEY